MRRYLDALLTLAALIAAWVLVIEWFKVPNYILPTPRAVLHALKIGYVDGVYWPHLWATFKATSIGYLLGCGLAFVVGSLAADSRTFERFVYPYVVGLQSMPKVALAPLVIVWFGFGIESKIVLVALICFFPLFVNTVTGIRSTDPDLLDLMRVFGRSRLDILLQVKLPHAATPIMAGMQIGVVLGLIGAVAAEFVASTRGLGFVIQNAANALNLGAMFAALFSLAAIGIAGTQLLRLAQRKLVFWDRTSGADVKTA